jgi:hypothetical protein
MNKPNVFYPYLSSQFQNVPLWPISALGSNFNPQNTQCILPVEIFARLFYPVSLRGTLTKLKRFEIGSIDNDYFQSKLAAPPTPVTINLAGSVFKPLAGNLARKSVFQTDKWGRKKRVLASVFLTFRISSGLKRF